MNRVWGLLLALSICLWTARALAEPTAAAPPPATPTYQPKILDYRYQLVISDLMSVGLFVAAAESDGSSALVIASLGTYLLVPPLIHVANGQAARGGASLAMRFGLPIIGLPLGFIAGGVASGGDGVGLLVGAVFGFLLGGITAMVVDDAFLGKVELPCDAERRPNMRPSYRVGLVPTVDPKQKSFGMALVGAF